MSIQHQVKVVGADGQITLGEEVAGKMVSVHQISDGTWIIKVGEFIPDSEKWLHQSDNLAKLDKALEWAANSKPVDSFGEFKKGIDNGKNKN